MPGGYMAKGTGGCDPSAGTTMSKVDAGPPSIVFG